MGKKLSGAQKRKKKREKEEAVERARADVERLKLGPTKIWTGLVVHHKDVFVSHVLPKLNRNDRFFFSKVNSESEDVLAYAGVDVSGVNVTECSSISTLEWAWNHYPWGKKDGRVIDQTLFCVQVAATNKLEFLKWAREEKHCEWDKWTIKVAVVIDNLEMLKYCFSDECPCDVHEEMSCKVAAAKGHLDCLRFLFDKVKPSRGTEVVVALGAAKYGHLGILKYLVEERKIPDRAKVDCMCNAGYGHLDCLQYLVEEAKVPLDDWQYIASARYDEHPDCVHYLQEKGCPEPTDEEYARYVAKKLAKEQQ